MKHIFEAQEVIAKLEKKYFHSGIHQITIDLIECAHELMHKDDSTELKSRDWPTTDELGSLSYQCGILLEVLNPFTTFPVRSTRGVNLNLALLISKGAPS